MDQRLYVRHPDRAVVAIGGDDRETFLQGLVSNDVRKVSGERAIWAAFLTPQGKFLHDLFIVGQGDRYLVDCEAARRDDLLRRLKMYKLRSKVTLEDVGDAFDVHVLWGAPVADLPAEPGAARAVDGGMVFNDPRLAAGGARAILPAGAAAEPLLAELDARPGDFAAWDQQRLALGLPDGSRDMTVDKDVLLELGWDELHGVDWDKGCYMGQEVTARTKYRGLVKKRLMPLGVAGDLPAPGTPITKDGKAVGEVRSGAGPLALGLVRLEALEGPLTAGDATLTPRKPDWAAF